MATKAIGGGSSAVAASAHAACARFRGTDPLITGVTRRKLAAEVGFHDDFGTIPEARWMRAMTFERLVRDERFASEVATLAVGRLGLARPTQVVIANARVSVDATAAQLTKAHQRAVESGAVTMLYGLAIPFVGFEDTRATDVKPDFAVIAPMLPLEGEEPEGSWLIMGDAKDYERQRSRIDDMRLLKGFLQVALGAESAAEWSALPDAMAVHRYGVLGVPRNAFLQPEPVVELLDDHRTEVRMRVAERRREAAGVDIEKAQENLPEFVRHLRAAFDPATCPTCTLFSYCRNELRQSTDPTDLLVELGVPADVRPHLVGLVDGTGVLGPAPMSVVAMVRASRQGRAQTTGQRRIDQAGLAGTVNVVIAKSDSAALGVYGMAVQRVTTAGPGEWQTTIFNDPQGAETRRGIMRVLGAELTALMKDRRKANAEEPEPIHLVVPDRLTADVLVSIADNLAGVEVSRLRWQRDKDMGRPALTFNGEEAEVPKALTDQQRTAVSFLLEDDRARTMQLRTPIVDLRAALSRHVVAGGPTVSSYRLDYLAAWASADGQLDHRAVSDDIEANEHTPGARMTSRRSNAVHQAFVGTRTEEPRPADPAAYDELVRDELAYKCEVMETALACLAKYPDSTLREVHRAIEGDAQAVWRRRLRLHASDLVRFGRTYRHWRNSLVPTIESDDLASKQLLALGNPQAAADAARDAGNRAMAVARVVDTQPLVLDIGSRRITDESRVALLHVNDAACIEGDDVDVVPQKTNFKFSGLSIGPLSRADDDDPPGRLIWHPALEPECAPGDQLVVADFTWFCDLKGDKMLTLGRPTPDTISAPTVDCDEHSYGDNPEGHQYCCKSHEVSEAEWADELAVRRARGELNPDVWPPVVDSDAFEVSAAGAPEGNPDATPVVPVPNDLIADDLDIPEQP